MTSRAPAEALGNADYWRDRVLHAVLVFFSAVGLIGYVPAVIAAISYRAWGVLAVDTIFYAGLVALCVVRTLPFRLRAAAVIALWFALSGFLLVALGPYGAGMAWCVGAMAMCAICFGRRGAIGGTVIAAAGLGTFVAVVASPLGGSIPVIPLEGAMQVSSRLDVASWGIRAGNVLLVGAMISFAIAALVEGVELARVRHQRALEELAQRPGTRLVSPTAGLDEGRKPARRRPASSPHDGEAARPLILIVDDEPGVREVTTLLLQRSGYAVVSAPDVAHAKVQLRTKPAIAGVVTDIDMPGTSGDVLVDFVRSLRPELPLIVATGRPGAADRLEVRIGPDRVVRKPFSRRELVDALARAGLGQPD